MIGPSGPQRTSPNLLGTLDDLQRAGAATDVDFVAVIWAVEAGRQALTEGPDWSFVLPRIVGLAVLAVVTTAWATFTFRSYQRSI